MNTATPSYPPPGHKAEATRLIQAALTEIELARRAFR
jgi:hypothetical protein